LLEAVAYIAIQQSFRQSPRESLVRNGADRAFVRSTIIDDQRETLVEIEIDPTKRDVVQRNRQRIYRSQQLAEILRVTVFTPDDLVLVKGGPAERRQYLDDLLIASSPKLRTVIQKMEKIFRQRNVLLRQSNGRLSQDIANTLDVWDAQLCDVGERVVLARKDLLEELHPRAAEAFRNLTRLPMSLSLEYQHSYQGSLREALEQAREIDLRRGLSTVGPQRDDFSIRADSLDSRTRLSQGRQRAITLALRLAAHDVVARASGTSPVLLLDDVFSELDEPTAEALFAELPVGQTLLTTAGVIPRIATAHCTVLLEQGVRR